MARAYWFPDASYVAPPSTVIRAGEDITLALDASALLAAGESVASATATLTRLDTLATVALTDGPTVAGNTVSQRIRDVLVADTTYLLAVYCQIGGRTQAMCLAIESPR